MIRPDLCLDFANTRFWRGQAVPTETLNAPADLAAWAKASKAPTAREFETALGLRETIHRLFDAQAQGELPASRDLETLNAALASAPGRRTLKRGREGYEWDVDMKSGTALSLLAPVLWSAGDLLAGGARIPSASTCFSTTAVRASAAGVRWRPAAIAPRPSGTITRAARTETNKKGPRGPFRFDLGA